MNGQPLSPCPSEDRLESLLHDANGDEQLLTHVADCPRCGRYVADARTNNAFLRDIAPLLPRRADPPCGAPPCENVPGYQVLGELRRGGQGIVYKAVQTATKREIALKTLLRGPFATLKQRLRFEREVELIAALRHPNIVTVYDSGVTPDGRPYFAMEFVDGIPLDEWMSSIHHLDGGAFSSRNPRYGSGRDHPPHGQEYMPMPPAAIGERSTAHRAVARAETRNPQSEIRTVLAMFAKICAAVSYAHQCGIAHRDLKPANILVDEGGEPHILDFGLAKFADGSASDHLQTMTGEFMGTPAYASPEQVSGRPDRIDVRTDVYTLGVILYETLTGQFPYGVTGSVPQALLSIAQAEPARPSTINPHLNDEIDTIVLKALAKPRERRYQSAAALYDDIQHYLAGEAINAKRDSTWYILKKTARRYRLQVGLAATAIVFLALLAVVMTVQSGRIARQRDRAVEAEDLAQSRATELAYSLSEARTERGRTLARLGNMPLADELIWREFLCPIGNQVGSTGNGLLPQCGSAHAYWALWELYARSGCLATLSGESELVTSVDFSPQGTRVVMGREDGSVILWSVFSAEKLATLQCSSVAIITTLFSPDGRQLLTLDGNGVLTLWNVGTRRPFHRLDVAAKCACFSTDGLALATGDAQGAVRVWDLATYENVAVVNNGPEEVSSISFGSDGRSLAWIAGRSVGIWDGQSVRETPMPSETWDEQPLRCVKLNSDFLAFAYCGDIRRWAAPFTGSPVTWVSHPGAYAFGLDFSPDGDLLASAGNDRAVKLWDTATGQCLRTFSGHEHVVGAVYFSLDRALLASRDRGAIKLWEVSRSPQARILSGHSDTVHSLSVSPDGQSLVSSSGDRDRTVRLWDLRSGQQKGEIRTAHADVIAAVSYSPDGRLLATGGYDRMVKLWDAATLEHQHTLSGHGGGVSALSFSPDGRTLASAGYEQSIRLWDVTTGACVSTLTGHHNRIPQLCFSPDGRTLASASIDKTLILWVVDRQEIGTVLTGDARAVRAVAFSPGGDLLASGSDDSTIKLWNPQSGECLSTLTGHDQDLFALAFSPDGRLLASGTRGGEIFLWDVATRRNVLVLEEGGAGAVFDLSFTPDGQTLISAGADQQIRLWDLTYFQRHIAGNMVYNLARFAEQMKAQHIDPQPLRDWARTILSRAAAKEN